MEFDIIKIVPSALQVINMLATLAIGAWLHLDRKNNATNSAVTELSQRVSTIEGELSKLSAMAETAPNNADLAKLYDSVNSLSATVNQLVGENRGQSDILSLILSQITQKGMA